MLLDGLLPEQFLPQVWSHQEIKGAGHVVGVSVDPDATYCHWAHLLLAEVFCEIKCSELQLRSCRSAVVVVTFNLRESGVTARHVLGVVDYTVPGILTNKRSVMHDY